MTVIEEAFFILYNQKTALTFEGPIYFFEEPSFFIFEEAKFDIQTVLAQSVSFYYFPHKKKLALLITRKNIGFQPDPLNRSFENNVFMSPLFMDEGFGDPPDPA